MTDQEAAVWAAVYAMRLKENHKGDGKWWEDRSDARHHATWAVLSFRRADAFLRGEDEAALLDVHYGEAVTRMCKVRPDLAPDQREPCDDLTKAQP